MRRFRHIFSNGDRCNIFNFKSDKIVSGGRIDNFLQHRFQLFGHIWHLAEQKININRYSAVKVGKGIDKQAAFQHKVFCIFGFLQTAQEFLLAKEQQTKLIASAVYLYFLLPCHEVSYKVHNPNLCTFILLTLQSYYALPKNTNHIA